MIALQFRFRGHNSLRGVYQKGKAAYSPSFKIMYVQTTGDKPYRAAVVVSKKVHKSAVVRNRIRRRTYEQVRMFMADNAKNVDLIIVALNEKPAHVTAKDFVGELAPLLKKTIGML